jgi:hypothetical protein
MGPTPRAFVIAIAKDMRSVSFMVGGEVDVELGCNQVEFGFMWF